MDEGCSSVWTSLFHFVSFSIHNHFTIFGAAYSCYTIKNKSKNEKKNSRRKLENE